MTVPWTHEVPRYLIWLQTNFIYFLFWFELGLGRVKYQEVNNFYTLLFHSLFKVEFDMEHFVLGEHRER